MFLDGGHSYVYLIYGIHHCFNVVTRSQQEPEAVLIRALEPDEGVEAMMGHRNCRDLKKLTTGPGRLTQALHIDRTLDGMSLFEGTLFIEAGLDIPKRQRAKGPRVNVDYAEEAAAWPLRFWIKSSEFVSRSFILASLRKLIAKYPTHDLIRSCAGQTV